MTSPTARLRELGITLPSVATPAGSYIPAKRAGGLVFTAGQVPFVDGALAATGKVGAEITPEQAYDHHFPNLSSTPKQTLTAR